MATILWPAFSDAVSDFLHRGVAARLLQRAGTLTTFLQAAYYFFPYFFRRIFAAALWTNRCQRSRSCWPVSGICLAKPLPNKKGLV
jgi:hypothetical protein